MATTRTNYAKKKKEAINKLNKLKKTLSLIVSIIIAIIAFLNGDTLIENVSSNELAPAITSDSKVKVHFVDVAQGDATIYEFDGKYALLDTGTVESREDLLAYMNDLNITDLEYMILTHPHSDHIGGAYVVIDEFNVKEILIPDLTKGEDSDSGLYNGVLKLAGIKNVPITTVKNGELYPLGDANFEILQADYEFNDELNNASIITYFDYPGISVLSTGDAEKGSEAQLLSKGLNLRADIYHAGHHGSSSSTTEDFIKAIMPRYTLISCGLDNKYGHPHKEVKELLAEYGGDIYRTDYQGDIVFTLENGETTIYTEKEADLAA